MSFKQSAKIFRLSKEISYSPNKRSSTYDPDEPIDPELFGREFAQELYKTFPKLKAAGLKQMEEYRDEKARQDESSEG